MMKIKYFCPRWGSENLSWDMFCRKVKAAGYDGIETGIPFDEAEKLEIKHALHENDLLLIGQYFQSFEQDFVQHAESFKKHLYNIIEMNPVLIDSQTGKDYFTAGQNKQLFDMASQISKESGILIAHETHRNKALYAAHVAKELLINNPDIVITADFSHWCNVSESFLEEHTEAVDLAVSKAVHIHARVGHTQSAQVPDPRVPEWQAALNTHLGWWDRIVNCRKNSAAATMTITPEFGPSPYLVHHPYTRMPVTNQWDCNIYIMELLKKRYNNS
jgi:sugar phosphate isomerase/epimerase